MNSIQKIESAVYAIRPFINGPITLSDILLCLGHKFAIDGDGYFLKDNERSSHEKLYIVGPTVRYNLRLSPYEQSEETLNFIAENLTK